LICALISGIPETHPVTLQCHPSRISDVAGHGRINIKRLAERFPSMTIQADGTLAAEEVAATCLNHTRKGSILSDLTYKPYEEYFHA
jgi:hypothetical protein